MISFWSRVVCNNLTKTVCISYKLIYHFKWITFIKQTLDHSGFSNIWLMQEHHNQKWLNSNFQTRSKDQFIQTWLSNIWTSTQCTNYRIFKTTFTPETYLSKLNRNDFINLCKFRVGNGKIPVVLGRYSNIIIEDRICPLCDFHDICDEYHYIFVCQFFNTLRKNTSQPPILKTTIVLN